ncbi:Uma2 family endonuclease [Runella sp.]|uniref:Uma2 family endonuclease n=1 Tax=Runella sp. TaxID=1960881 RepID=UPI003D0CB9D5
MTLVDQIFRSPHLPQILQELNSLWEKEQADRRAFYEQISENDKAEFINGQPVFHSPVKRKHSSALDFLQTLLSVYVRINGLGRIYVEKLMIELTRNSFEPDLCFFTTNRDAQFNEEQMLFPAPDFIIEILSRKTEKYDRGVKFEDYEAHGIKEYWIVDPTHKTIEQYLLKNKRYELAVKSTDGYIESKVIKGFKMPIRAGFYERKNLKALQEILKP